MVAEIKTRYSRDAERMPEVTNHDLDKRLALLEQTVLRLAIDLHQINGSINKLVWAVGGAVLVAIMKFVLSGGLNVIP